MVCLLLGVMKMKKAIFRSFMPGLDSVFYTEGAKRTEYRTLILRDCAISVRTSEEQVCSSCFQRPCVNEALNQNLFLKKQWHHRKRCLRLRLLPQIARGILYRASNFFAKLFYRITIRIKLFA